jgi:hypothetical protein
MNKIVTLLPAKEQMTILRIKRNNIIWSRVKVKIPFELYGTFGSHLMTAKLSIIA